jgi:hypothetical protein
MSAYLIYAGLGRTEISTGILQGHEPPGAREFSLLDRMALEANALVLSELKKTYALTT